ncbi:MAG TPA: M20/M25/M40 family metallo-hydrolase [Candidatus Acidoferrum sp.]|nr:M20/M25/M40 family metallo-hydrolase [Candidatus Acidoferrum sp.]
MDMKDVLFELAALSGISGMEDRLSERAEELFKPYADKVETDALFNVVATKLAESPTEETLLLDAHMDEIGLIVTGVTDQGFLKFDNLNGVDRRTILASEVTVYTEHGDYYGIVAAAPPHLMKPEDQEKTPTFDTLYIDVGFGPEKAKELFSPGNFITLKQTPTKLLGNVVTGKSFDDRSSVAAIWGLFKALRDVRLPFNLVALLSSQEETGLRGARVVCHRANPTEAIAIDVTFAYLPDCPRERTALMGKGPALTYAPILDRTFTDRLREVAKANDIPLQYEVGSGTTGTNSFAIFNTGKGVKTALLSIPLKYMHSVVETLDFSDVKNTTRLLKEYIMDKKEAMESAR